MKFVKPLNMFKELLKRKPSKRGRLLGLIINDKHVDSAVSDPNNINAVPLSASHLQEGNMDLIAEKFQTLGATIKNFINDLIKTRKFQGFKYTYWDDLIATKHMDFVVKHNVEFILENLNLPQLEPKEIVNKFVAARLLQGYLESVNFALELNKDVFHK
ncbi:hypothetical protein Ddye_002070 [Dipteronia dyeriana]|uniref:Uncharacterized protein n=1 Tax=Dipteronia dyeriana TaxID=168575 RepID=A0AAD9XPM4_9ROSI|nr:hypothetical protein Ddye_002070 [Dipteronia dyeriana]